MLFQFNKFIKTMRLAHQLGWINKEMYLRIVNIHKYNGILTCELCNESIGSKSNNDNRAFSLDHIISVSKGGHNLVENLRVAHRICNEKRGRI